MKATLQPIYFNEANERERQELSQQLDNIKKLYGGVAAFLEPIPAGSTVPAGADAIVFPQLIGAAFHYREALSAVKLPFIVLTSEFGTVEMWDWEIVTFLRSAGCNVFSPYSVELANVVLRGLGVKKQLSGGKFVMFQDSPGEGMQAYIFKRFYWWEKECTERMEEAFGLKIIYKSWKAVAEEAKRVSDAEAESVSSDWNVPCECVPREDYLRAAKLYVAVKRELDAEGSVLGVGCNCLNESFHSDTTPCLAWNMLFEKTGILYACEGDTLTLISKYILYHSTKAPIMMTNIYPFLMGMAALKHEKIETFPDIEDPDNHALLAHCGYFGLVMREFASEWTLRPKALAIVDDHALAVDARFPTGPLTIAKIHPDMEKLIVIDAELEGYAQYPGSDCRNGGIVRYKDGHAVMDALYSHHALFLCGKHAHELKQLARVFGWQIDLL